MKVGFETLGCRSNYADTVEIQAAIDEKGLTSTTDKDDLDVFVLNTCSVTDAADKTALKIIRSVHRSNPDAKIIVTGCMAEVSRDKLLQIEGVDQVIGTGRNKDVVKAITGETIQPLLINPSKKERRGKKSISLDGDMSKHVTGPDDAIGQVKNRSRYHLRIQEGCDNFCTFCIIPQTRGALSSRTIKDILNDISHLQSVGYREVVLTGTHIGGYGEDLGYSLKDLLLEIVEQNPSLRVRLSSIDPNDLSTEIVDIVAKHDIFCEHLHICVQAFDDFILKRMNRLYNMKEVEELIAYVKQTIPGCCIGSDLIAGFPGESRQLVDQAVDRFLGLPISYLHVFPYSEREGTAAPLLDGSIDVTERKRRVGRWRSLSEQRRIQFLSDKLDQSLEVILEDSNDEYFFGTSREYASVAIPRQKSDDFSSGQIIEVVAKSIFRDKGKLLCEA